MKKLLLIAFAAFATISASAQTGKGSGLLGGTISFESEKYGDYKTTYFTFSPEVGYFFIDNFAGGLRFDIWSEKYDGDKYSSTAIAPFLRYYFLPMENKVRLFADASYGFGTEKDKSGSSTDKWNFSSFTASAGPVFFLSPNTALMVALRYNNWKYKDASDAYNTIGLNVGFQVHLDFNKK